jgi:hypothetical protein
MALNSRGAADDVEAGEEVVVSEEVGTVVGRVVESIPDTERDSVGELIVWLDVEGIDEIDSVDSRSVADVAIDSIIVSDDGKLVEVIVVDVVSVDIVSIVAVSVDVVPVDVVSVVDRCDVEYVSTLETEIIAVSDVVGDFHIENSESVGAVELGTERLGKADVDSDSVEDAVGNRDSRSVLIPELVESVEKDMRIVEPPVVSSDVDAAVVAKVDAVTEDVDPPDWKDVTVVLDKSCKVSRTAI